MAVESLVQSQHFKEIRRRESKIEFSIGGGFTILVGATLYYVYTLFQPLAPPANLTIWTATMGLSTALIALTAVAFLVRNPAPDEVEKYWSRFGQCTTLLFDIAVAMNVWLLLPYASEQLQLLMVIFYSAAISGQVIASAEATGNNVIGVILIFGSAAVFFLLSNSAYAVSLAVFLLAFGCLLLIVGVMLKHAIRSAIASSLESERISRQLALALESAQSARDARTRFIAAASHDLRQPIQAAMLFFHQAIGHPDPARRQIAIEGVNNGFSEANALLERMMEHLRLERAGVPIHNEPIALDAIFQGLMDEFAPASRANGIRMRAMPCSRFVFADPALVTRILRNLIQNVQIHSEADKLLLFARGADPVRIYVIDDGVGVAKDQEDRIFAAYSQGRSALRHSKGMGLGLSIAQELARLMEGNLALDTRWRKGSAFCLSLPACKAEISSALQLATGTKETDFKGRHMLVVDDDKPCALALGGTLELAGAEVRIAQDLDEVHTIIASGWKCDIVLTDWHIGEHVTGFNVIAASLAAWPNVPVIILSGDGHTLTAEQIASTGFPSFWKPIPYERVKLEIQKQIGSIN